jgi:outer membrane receptor protein involved in Fe transport
MQMRSLLMCTIISLTTLSFTFAQTGNISGTVTSAENGDPLPGVNIAVEGTQLGAATDENGEYVIISVPPGEYDVVASFVGYTTVRQTNVLVEIDRTTTVDFSMQSEVVEEDEIVVTAQPQIMHMEVSSSQQVITPEELETAPGTRSLDNFLQRQASFTGEMEIRGGSADQIGMRVDGLQLTSQRFDSPETAVPLSGIRQVAVTSGGFNAEYGDTRSGVIDVTTKAGPSDRYEGEIDISLNRPRAKHRGPSIFSVKNYWLRPHLDPEVAFEGTASAWEDDPYIRQQYPRFSGWENLVQQYNANRSPEDHASPLDLYLWDAWMHTIELPVDALEAQGFSVEQELVEKFEEHARKKEGTEPDWNIDFGFGGPIPFVSDALGNATFYFSHNTNRQHYALPVKRRHHQTSSNLLTIQSFLTDNIRLNLKGYYKTSAGVLNDQAAYYDPDLTFQPINNLHKARDVGGGVNWAPDFYSPADRTTAMVGANLSHTISPRTQWSIRLSGTRHFDEAGAPYTPRDSTVIRFGPIPVLEEMPYGWSPGNTQIGDFQYGEYEQPYAVGGYFSNLGHAWFDSTITNQYNVDFDISSQVTEHNLIKTGVDFGYTRFDNNTWSYRFGHPENNQDLFWDRKVFKAGVFAQDRVTFEGIVANLGVRTDYYAPQGEWPQAERYNYGVYGGATQDIWKRWRQMEEEGINVLHPVDHHFTVSPRVGLSFPVTTRSKFFFNYGHFRSLNPSRTMWMVQVDQQAGVDNLGNPNMVPPRTIAYETGVEYNLRDQYLLRISGYYKNITGQHASVDYVSRDGRLSYDTYQNNEYRDIQGVEFSISKRVGRWISGWLNYNYMLQKTGWTGVQVFYEDPSRRAEFGQYQGQTSRPVPRPRFHANVTISTPYESTLLGDWQLSILPTWIAGQHFTWNPLGKLHLHDNLQWSNYHVWDLKLSKFIPIGIGRAQLYIDVQNVFDQNVSNMASGIPFSSGADRRNYLSSLRLPMYESEEFETLRERNPGQYQPGDDEPGMLRSEERPYINDPNITTLLFSEPRMIWFGLDVRF